MCSVAGFATFAINRQPGNRHLIPPGQIRDQIKGLCMLLGNVDPNTPERNFMPFSIQVEFDDFASAHCPLMRDTVRAKPQ